MCVVTASDAPRSILPRFAACDAEDVWEGIIRESFGTRVRTDFGKKVITADTHRRLHAFYRGYNSELAELLGEPHFASIWMPPH